MAFRHWRAALMLLALPPAGAYAQVQVNPATINGTVQVTGHTVIGGSIVAKAGDQAASTTPSNGAYTLTVNTPATGTVDYSLGGYVYLGSYSTLMVLPNPSARATVSAGSVATADILVNPASLNVNVSVTGGTASSIWLQAYGSGWDRWGSITASGASASMPVPANPSIQIYGTLTLTDGRQFALTSQSGIRADEGQQVSVSWTVDTTAAGAIEGRVSLLGAQNISHISVYAYGPTNRGTTANSVSGVYAMPNLPPGTYSMVGYVYRTGGGYFQPPASAFTGGSRSVRVTAGQVTTVDITADAAYVTGALDLTGTQSVTNLTSATVYLIGTPGQTSGGFGYAPVSLPAGTFDALVSGGSWLPYFWNLGFRELGGHQYLQIIDYSTSNIPVTAAVGAPAETSASYALGTVDIGFSVAGGGTLSNPQLSGFCSRQNEALYFYPQSYLYVQNVPEATVRIIGLDGHCTLDAYAIVSGSRVSFGKVSFDVTAGSRKVIGIGGPSVALSSPVANATLDSTTVTVTGTATGGNAIAGVTVNGVASSTLTSTNNPADPNEVAFSVSLTLVSGDNTIETVATDIDGKTALDSRIVTVTVTTVTVTVTASSPTVVYGSEIPDITPSYVGFLNGDTVSQEPTCTTDYTATSPAGSTPATSCSGAIASNYEFSYVQGTVTVDKRSASVTAGSGTKVYGTTDRALTDVTTTGFVETDLAEITFEQDRAPGENAGEYAVTATALGDLSNYDVDYRKGTFSITKAALTVVANDKTRSYLAADPILDGTLTGVVSGDGITATYTSQGTGSQVPGVYPIVPALVDPSGKLGNYEVTSTSGTLTVTNAPPVCGAVAPSVTTLWPPDHRLVPVSFGGASDVDGGPLTYTVTSIFQDEPTNTNGDGNTAQDGFGVGTGAAQVRAERTGDPKNPGNGRVYYIGVRVEDSLGAHCEATVTIGVPHDQGRRRIPIGDGPLYDSRGETAPPPAAAAAKRQN